MSNKIQSGSERLPKDGVLLRMGRSGWAWEFLRSNPVYWQEAKAATDRRQILRARPLLSIIKTSGPDDGWKWGLCIAEQADRSYDHAAVFWHPDIDPSVLPIAAMSVDETDGRDDTVDFRNLPFAVTVLKEESGKEHVLLCDGVRAIQLHVQSGTVLEGPVHLAFQPERLALKKEEMLTLDRLSTLRRDGWFDDSQFLPHPKAERWLLALKVLSLAPPDIRPDYIKMAAALFSGEEVSRWTADNDWIRSRLRRAVDEGRYLMNGGYLKILSSDNADFIPPRLPF